MFNIWQNYFKMNLFKSNFWLFNHFLSIMFSKDCLYSFFSLNWNLILIINFLFQDTVNYKQRDYSDYLYEYKTFFLNDLTSAAQAQNSLKVRDNNLSLKPHCKSRPHTLSSQPLIRVVRTNPSSLSFSFCNKVIFILTPTLHR